MLVELLEDHTVGWKGRRERVVDEAERGTGDEVSTIRVGLGHGRAEVPVSDGERARHATTEWKVILGEVAHGLGRRAGHEALTCSPVVGLVGDFPVVAHAVGLALGRHVERVDVVALTIRVLCRRLTIWPEGEPIAPSDEPKDVVKRVIFHHEDHDVFDVGHLVGARSTPGVGERSGLENALALEGGCRSGARGR